VHIILWIFTAGSVQC